MKKYLTSHCKHGIINLSNEREVVSMSKKEFLKKWRNDRGFRYDMKRKGIKVIQDNVIFLNPDGSVGAVAGAYIQ